METMWENKCKKCKILTKFWNVHFFHTSQENIIVSNYRCSFWMGVVKDFFPNFNLLTLNIYIFFVFDPNLKPEKVRVNSTPNFFSANIWLPRPKNRSEISSCLKILIFMGFGFVSPPYPLILFVGQPWKKFWFFCLTQRHMSLEIVLVFWSTNLNS